MSRTDVHRPWRVQVADPHNRHRLYRFQGYPTEAPNLEPTYNICGCPLCSGKHWRKAERRQQRHGQRKHIEQELDT